MERGSREEKGAKGSKRDKQTCTYLMLHCCKANRLNPLHSWWLPFWNMRTTSRLYSAELREQLTPHHHAAQTVSLLSESLWGRKKIISNTKLCVCTSNTRGKLWLPELGGGQARVSLCARETKALPLWSWTHTKQGAELLNGGVTAEDNHSCQFNEIALLLASVLDTCFKRKKSVLWEMHWDDKTCGNKLIETVDSTNFCPEVGNAKRIWISPTFPFLWKRLISTS